ncbi:nuclear transport factor 2 [Pleurocapsa sp. CCALA 161]|uniref:nuclear transport factor 2 n=1 Tax=Pleurocapsa sp. CCALA 161 TaxID=2107688 RepID=UPI000D074C5D|nr:nuclear transport factor 2 [Pleurocapsa sp. CCALA 161]PSB11187.1 nuclear transport factor 2 [Pleurocapsa sp. CCALA 161]
MTYIETSSTIAGISKSAISDYFVTVNQAEFAKTASLFAENGTLLPPFEKPIIGRANIAAYLSKEAKGMKLLPQQGVCEAETDWLKYKVLGKVKTSLFNINVAWHFILGQEEQIDTVQIKLLASPQELLSLQSK